MRMLPAEIMFDTEIIQSFKGSIILYIFTNRTCKMKKRKTKLR